MGEKEEEVAKMEETKGDDGFRGRPSHHWMMISIQASVRGFNYISICFDCVVINHQKREDCQENGPIRPLLCDFGD